MHLQVSTLSRPAKKVYTDRLERTTSFTYVSACTRLLSWNFSAPGTYLQASKLHTAALHLLGATGLARCFVSHFPFFLSHAKRRTRPGSSCACTGWTRRSRTGPSTSSARWPCRPPLPRARRPPRTSPHAWLSTASSVRFSSSRGACVLGVVSGGARVGWRHRRLCCPTRADGKNIGQRLCRPVHHRVSSSLSLVCSPGLCRVWLPSRPSHLFLGRSLFATGANGIDCSFPVSFRPSLSLSSCLAVYFLSRRVFGVRSFAASFDSPRENKCAHGREYPVIASCFCPCSCR